MPASPVRQISETRPHANARFDEDGMMQ